MKALKVISWLVISGFVFATTIKSHAADESSDKIDLSAPPFWMFSYDEFIHLQADQKSFYLKGVKPRLKKLYELRKTSDKEIAEASEWHETWKSIQRKVSRACLDTEVTKFCDDLAELRIKTLDLKANQKQENRKAASNAAVKN